MIIVAIANPWSPAFTESPGYSFLIKLENLSNLQQNNNALTL